MSSVPLPRKIGFVTCAEHRDLVDDDLILAAALERRGAKVVPLVWTETAPEATGCDLLLLRSCWDYHLRPEAFLSWVNEASRYAYLVNSAEIVRWNMDKRYLRDIEEHGFAVPKTISIAKGGSADLPVVLCTSGLDAVVVKPAISLSAFETYLVQADEAETFTGRLNQLLLTRDMLVQEFIAEIASEGEWSITFIGGEFSHAVKKLPKAGDFRVQHEYGGSAERASPSELMVNTAEGILRRFAPQAVYCRADVVECAEEVTLMELELIDPVLHFELAPEAAERMAELLLRVVS
jgi:glutathione synthase/RimK-type ligase-like ATP-grasp enzyme